MWCASTQYHGCTAGNASFWIRGPLGLSGATSERPVRSQKREKFMWINHKIEVEEKSIQSGPGCRAWAASARQTSTTTSQQTLLSSEVILAFSAQFQRSLFLQSYWLHLASFLLCCKCVIIFSCSFSFVWLTFSFSFLSFFSFPFCLSFELFFAHSVAKTTHEHYSTVPVTQWVSESVSQLIT